MSVKNKEIQWHQAKMGDYVRVGKDTVGKVILIDRDFILILGVHKESVYYGASGLSVISGGIVKKRKLYMATEKDYIAQFI